MNPALPTGWRGRLLALALAGIALVMVYGAVAAPLLDLYADNTRRAERQRALVGKLAAIAAGLPALRARIAELRAATAADRLTLDGASDPIAAAALQGRVAQLASAAALTIGSTESITTEAQGPFRRIGLRLMLNGGYEGLVKLLAGLEAARPPLIVDNLQIRSLQRRQGTNVVAALDASVDIYGFRASEPADAPKQ